LRLSNILKLDSLKDPKNRLDQQSEEVAKGYYDSANVIHQKKGDLVRAEMLIRESLRIRARLYDNNHYHVGLSIGTLAPILKAQGKLGHETKEAYECCLQRYSISCNTITYILERTIKSH
jgi:hypothetical protein